MIIEFVGLPGAGKTTIAKALKNSSDFEYIKIRKKSELILLNFKYLIKNPIQFVRRLSAIVVHSYSFKMFYYKLMNVFLDVNAKYEKSLSFDMVILEQGYFQSILSLYDRVMTDNEMANELKKMLLPSLLIFVSADKDLRGRRLLKRGYGFRKVLGEDNKRSWYHSAEINFDKMKKIKNNLKIETMELDGKKSVNENLKVLLNKIDETKK